MSMNDLINDYTSKVDELNNKKKKLKIAHRILYFKYLMIVFSAVSQVLNAVFTIFNVNKGYVIVSSFLTAVFISISDSINIYNIDMLKIDIKKLETDIKSYNNNSFESL